MWTDALAEASETAGKVTAGSETNGIKYSLRDYTNYITEKARAEYANDKRFSKWAHKNLAFISAASWDGAHIPAQTLLDIDEIKAAQSKTEGRGSSYEDYPLGRDAARDTLRERCVERLLDAEHGSAVFKDGKILKINGVEQFTGEVAREKKAFIVIGRPAGGKSRVFANPLSYANKARILDCDTVKPWLNPGYDDGYGAGYVQDESDAIKNSAYQESTARGENIVIPKIGGKGILKIAKDLKALGYTINLYYNEVSQETSIMRAASRFAEEGRYLDLRYLQSIGSKPYDTFVNYANNREYFDYAEWRNNDVGFGEEPALKWKTGDARNLSTVGVGHEYAQSGGRGQDSGIVGVGSKDVGKNEERGQTVKPQLRTTSETDAEFSSWMKNPDERLEGSMLPFAEEATKTTQTSPVPITDKSTPKTQPMPETEEQSTPRTDVAESESVPTDSTVASVATIDAIKAAYTKHKRLQRAVEKVTNKTPIAAGDKSLVEAVMNGTLDISALRARENGDALVAYYNAKKALNENDAVIKKARDEHRARLTEEANTALENSDSWTDKKTGFQYARETQERNIRDIVGKSNEADAAYLDIRCVSIRPCRRAVAADIHSGSARSLRLIIHAIAITPSALRGAILVFGGISKLPKLPGK